MGNKNSQVHLLIEAERLVRLKLEAKKLGMSVNELIRRRLSLQPISEELLLLRKLVTIIKNGDNIK